jgi:cyclic pyranopterin phosphate synthase
MADVRMIDVGEKPVTRRRAEARAVVHASAEVLQRLAAGTVPKGDVLATARVAGIMAAKRTPELIPLCHAVALTGVKVDLEVDGPGARVIVTATADALDRTGVEMEALVAVSAACLTIYDMLKGIDRDLVISDVKLLEKSGGRTGHYVRGGDRRA